MVILEDKGQKKEKHRIVHESLTNMGHEIVTVPLPVGDYILMNNKIQNVIDRKNARKTVVGKEVVRLKNGKCAERNIYEYGVDLKKMDFVGTYNICVDTKCGIEEILGNICGASKEHSRFRDECILAQNNGIKLIILVENRGKYLDKKCTIYNPTIYDLESLHNWKNPRAFITRGGRQVYPTATKGIVLQKACMTMQMKYGVEFKFCRPDQSGEMILELLGVKGEENGRRKKEVLAET